MASAGVRELRASELLRRVEAGETIQITDRGRPVALLSPTPEGGPYQQMVTSGEIERATRRFDDPPEPVELEPGVELPSVTRARLREHERCRPPSTWTRPRSSSSPFANRKRTRSVAISAAAVLGSQVPLRGSRCCGRFWTRVRQHGKPGGRALADLDLVRVENRVLDLAGGLRPFELRTLDAIHLATAQRLGVDLGRLCTYDDLMQAAAGDLGMAVIAPA